MPGPKLNERPVIRTRLSGRARAIAPSSTTKAVARYVRVSPYKVRQVLDLVRGHDVARAQEILRFCERDAATLVGKVLTSAVANAEHNDSLAADELFVSACFADEGPTLKCWRPRARGRATRIRKRTCHVTVIVSRLPESALAKRRSQRPAATAERRRRRTGQERPSRFERRRSAAEAPAEQAAAPTPPEEPAPDVPPDAAPEVVVPVEEPNQTHDDETEDTERGPERSDGPQRPEDTER
ncbi:MAG: 50S ribosomal protein L22 [Acidimicrobiales bacterium]